MSAGTTRTRSRNTRKRNPVLRITLQEKEEYFRLYEEYQEAGRAYRALEDQKNIAKKLLLEKVEKGAREQKGDWMLDISPGQVRPSWKEWCLRLNGRKVVEEIVKKTEPGKKVRVKYVGGS